MIHLVFKLNHSAKALFTCGAFQEHGNGEVKYERSRARNELPSHVHGMGNSCVLWCSCTETAFTVLVTNLRQRKNDNLFLPFHQVWLDAVQDLFTIFFVFIL